MTEYQPPQPSSNSMGASQWRQPQDQPMPPRPPFSQPAPGHPDPAAKAYRIAMGIFQILAGFVIAYLGVSLLQSARSAPFGLGQDFGFFAAVLLLAGLACLTAGGVGMFRKK